MIYNVETVINEDILKHDTLQFTFLDDEMINPYACHDGNGRQCFISSEIY